jgi:hypothetical protein
LRETESKINGLERRLSAAVDEKFKAVDERLKALDEKLLAVIKRSKFLRKEDGLKSFQTISW